VMFCLNLHRDLDPDPRGLEADDLHLVGHVLPVRIALGSGLGSRVVVRLFCDTNPRSGVACGSNGLGLLNVG
jgi:hypothetical protein